MTWKYNKKSHKYERPCSHCHGSGIEVLDSRDCHCCPWGRRDASNLERLIHPANSIHFGGTEDTYISQELMICKICQTIWMIFHEPPDDSMDIPGPELIGKKIPDQDWRYKAQ